MRKCVGLVLPCCVGIVGLNAVAGCQKNPASTPANGSVLLAVKSTKPVDHVFIKVWQPNGKQTTVEFDTSKDLTKEAEVGEIFPGASAVTTPILFAGFGSTKSSSVIVSSGRVIATFVPGKRSDAVLSLQADLVDVDQDGYTKQEDCNDNASAESPFFNEICDNNADDNCNGSFDEGCKCSRGDTRACYTGPPLTRNVGQCRDGFQVCNNDTWGDCSNSVVPQKQFCDNGQDGNCDGSIDEGCSCTPGTSRYCWGKFVTGINDGAEVITAVKGVCRAGKQTCEGTSWGACKDAVYPTTEACNGLDDDCNGVRDNGAFDKDGDGFTSCGTVTASVVAAAIGPCLGKAESDGDDPALADCDDNDPSRHPCQADRCGDMSVDDNCDGSFNECQSGNACSSQGYFGGYTPAAVLGDTSTRFGYQCAFSGDNYGLSCLASGVCSDVSDCQTPVLSGSPSAFVRGICRQQGGCDPGTKNPPFDGGNVTNVTDPFNDCGVISCDTGARVYAGNGSGPTDLKQTGWVISGTSFVCNVKGPVSADASLCYDGTCEMFRNCRDLGSTPVATTLPAGSISNACQRPLHSYDAGGAADLGDTCVTLSSGTSIDPAAEPVDNGSPDPLGRCNQPVTGCVGMVVADWAVNGGTVPETQTLHIATTNPNVNYCNGGVCSAPAANVLSCGPGTSLECETPCIDSDLTAGTFPAASVSICFNTNGGVSKTGACYTDSGTTCFSLTPGKRGDAHCSGQCLSNALCGRKCAVCAAGSQCEPGYANAGGFSTAPVSNGVQVDCMCPTDPTSNNHTAPMYCNGTCCALGEACRDTGTGPRCSSSGFTYSASGRMPCGNVGSGNVSLVTCNAATQFCDTSMAATPIDANNAPFKCVDLTSTGLLPCNQRACNGTTQACGDFAKSFCESCTTDSQCGSAVAAPDCSGVQSCALAVGQADTCDNYSCLADTDTAHTTNSCCGSSCAECPPGSGLGSPSNQCRKPGPGVATSFSQYSCGDPSGNLGGGDMKTCCGPSCKTCGGSNTCKLSGGGACSSANLPDCDCRL